MKGTPGKRNGRAENGCAFDILQIVASQQKHLFRCVPRVNDVAALCAQLEGLDADDDAEDFEDAPSTALTLRRGLFCGSCGGEVAACSSRWPCRRRARTVGPTSGGSLCRAASR